MKRLDPSRLSLDGLNCRCFSGIAPGFARQEHIFVYLTGNTTEQSLRQHAAALGTFDGFIVIPKGLAASAAGRFLLKSFTRQIHVYDDMMWGEISHLLTPYLKYVTGLVESLADDHYVSPSLPDLGTDRDAVSRTARAPAKPSWSWQDETRDPPWTMMTCTAICTRPSAVS